jgi:UDP-N-acetylglucosamine 2-epimerase (non-hydrolysing)
MKTQRRPGDLQLNPASSIMGLMEQKLKVMTIFGTRPEAVKMAPVIKALREHPDHIDITVCVTAQHREMLDQVLQAFDIIPDIDLDLMDHDQTLPELTARIFTHLDPVLLQIRPDWLLVQGDTTTVMAAAILGYYRQIRVGHIEAGLRTHDKWQPFPEEMNRRIAGVVADLHFAPTENNRQNLLREGIPDEIIKITGNPVIDALKIISQQPAPPQVDQLLDQTGVSAGKRRLVLVTAHRRENFGQPILDICLALKRLAQAYQDEIVIVYPVHLNPNIHVPVHQALSGIDNIHLLPPLDYLPLVHLMKHATLILTDSGGIQEEAPSFGVPTLVLRQRTERQEGVQAGTLKLVGTDPDTIFMEALKLLDDRAAHAAMSGAVNPYGDGHAAERIVAALLASQTG